MTRYLDGMVFIDVRERERRDWDDESYTLRFSLTELLTESDERLKMAARERWHIEQKDAREREEERKREQARAETRRNAQIAAQREAERPVKERAQLRELMARYPDEVKKP